VDPRLVKSPAARAVLLAGAEVYTSMFGVMARSSPLLPRLLNRDRTAAVIMAALVRLDVSNR
jgi:hypothetical protein